MRPLPSLPEWVTLEHDVAKVLTQQEEHGWRFDVEAARELECALRQELFNITQVLQDRFPYVPGKEFTPKRNNKRQGYVEGAPFTRLKDFNPASRDHVAWILTNYDHFQSQTTTTSGKMKIDETTLKNHGTGLSLQFFRILEITKSLGMISEGVNAWLRLSTNAKRLHHGCSTGAATGRCVHSHPNLAQVPSDERFRRLFLPTEGQVMVGADLSGVELRMLAHYLARYDGGRYADILLNDDIHQVNADKIGITRKLVKNVTYAFLYGAGDMKIGHTYDPLLSDARAKSKGKEIRAAYVDAIPGLSDLLGAIRSAGERGFVRAIDERKIKLSSPHCALNYLLQGSSATLAKKWLLLAHDNPYCCSQLAFIHDELQYECDPEHSVLLQSHLESSATKAGEYYKLRCPIAAESKVGANWHEVH
jgi:DNA polymerase I-like protein with 3'-5' exonuclease and polymerase domains